MRNLISVPHDEITALDTEKASKAKKKKPPKRVEF
jgi:hypothetical protein